MLTVRAGPRFERERFATLDEALGALEAHVAELTPSSTREEMRLMRRRIEPVRQVAARLELAGPGGWAPTRRGGIDLRGDGSAEAFTGRVRRVPVERRNGESAAAALRRAMAT